MTSTRMHFSQAKGLQPYRARSLTGRFLGARLTERRKHDAGARFVSNAHSPLRIYAAGGGAVETVEGVVNGGLAMFDKKKYTQAIDAFNLAEGMSPKPEELRAITYNRACANVKLGKYELASEDLKRAVNDYGVKYKTLIQDPDLAAMKALPIFDELSDQLKGGSTEAQQIKLRAESKSPFRLFRLIAAGGGSVGAFIALFTTIPALIKATQTGGDDLNQQLTNLVVNAASLVVLLFIVLRDLAEREKSERVMERLEQLGKLQVKRGNSKPVAVSRLRGTQRPVIVAGTSAHVKAAVKQAQAMRADLQTRGIVVVGVVLNSTAANDKIAALKREKGFGGAKEAAGGDGLVNAAEGAAPLAGSIDDTKGLKLDALEVEDWKAWINAQMAEAGVAEGANVYISLGLDGSVVSSGLGAPKWANICQELEPLDSTKTKFTNV